MKLEVEKDALRSLAQPLQNRRPGRGKQFAPDCVEVAGVAESFDQITVTSLISGHRLYSRPGVISAHVYGAAVDVAAFLMWAAEPHLEDRKRTGFMVMVFLLIFTGLIYLTKKSVYANKEH